MERSFAPFAFVFAASLSLILGCGSSTTGEMSVGGAPSTVPIGLAGASGSGGANTVPGAGAGGAGTATGGADSNTGGAPTTAGAGGMSTTAGAGGASTTAGAGGMSMGGSSGGGGGVVVPTGPLPHGKSTGCGKIPAGADNSTNTTLHEAKVTATMDPVWLAPSGKYYLANKQGVWDYTHRPYSVKLPKNYDNTKAYPITLGGGGCGSDAAKYAAEAHPGGGYQPDSSGASIQVGLMYLSGCFDDGGPGIDLRTDTPEIPYIRQVIADVEANYCADQSLVFISGTSSGGWESYTGGCAAADTIRAIGPVSGGLRLHRPACTGPQASIMVEGKTDNENPIGPITPPVQRLDSPGSAPARDEILKRNGCVAADFAFTYTDINGNAPHATWDAMYPDCVAYTGCPKETPVVWCALPGGHQTDTDGKTDYKGAIWKFWSSLPSRP